MNLEKSRLLFAFTIAGFLVLCNLAYLFANSQGSQNALAFAAKIDQPPIQLLSLLLLSGIIVFAIIGPKSNEDEP
jgi:hypothetical protein